MEREKEEGRIARGELFCGKMEREREKRNLIGTKKNFGQFYTSSNRNSVGYRVDFFFNHDESSLAALCGGR